MKNIISNNIWIVYALATNNTQIWVSSNTRRKDARNYVKYAKKYNALCKYKIEKLPILKMNS
jgi:hypothetical protein